MILVAFADIDSMPSRIPSSLIATMPRGMRDYLTSGGNEQAQLERICAVHLLCKLLETCGLGKEHTIVRDKNGRPYFSDMPAIDFNISHSGGMCACIIGDSRVGIDIQEVVPSIDIRRLSGRFFTKDEQAAIRRAIVRSHAFFSLWTKKEALGKYLGDGLVPMLRQNTAQNYAERGLVAWHTTLVKGERKFLVTSCASEEPEIIR